MGKADMKHNQQRKRSKSERRGSSSLFERIQPDAAGVDCGQKSHFVAVPPERDPEPVREFRTFTAELHRLADWLTQCGVKTVAMESTGVYWIPLYEILEQRGFEVVLVNAWSYPVSPGCAISTDYPICRSKTRGRRISPKSGEPRVPTMLNLSVKLVAMRMVAVSSQSSTQRQHETKATNGLSMQTQSLLSILIGGVAFETPATETVLPAADANTSFDLFDTRAQAFQPASRHPQTYELIFNESVRGSRRAHPSSFVGFRSARSPMFERKST
jgi:Transposase